MKKICSNKKCVHEGKPQENSEFHRNDRMNDGLQSQCKTCLKICWQRKDAKKNHDWMKIIIG
jgi:aspartate carbamoyltransferase regulatory subunit